MLLKTEIIRLCQNLNETIAWYKRVLSIDAEIIEDSQELEEIVRDTFQIQARSFARFWVGQESFVYAEVKEVNPVLYKVAPNHMSFQHIALMTKDIEAATESLKTYNTGIISTGVQTIPSWNKKAGGIKVLYFYDTNGFPLVFVELPLGKGSDKWRQHSNQNILGIDHSVISTISISESRKWYEKIGYKFEVDDLRYGIEQDNLTSISGAKVKLVVLQGAESYGIELISYLKPGFIGQSESRKQQALIIYSHYTDLKGLQRDPSGHLVFFC